MIKEKSIQSLPMPTSSEAQLSQNLLPFSFAKKHKVFIENMNDEKALIVHQGFSSLETISELQRVIQRPLEFKLVSEDIFTTLLAKAYENTNNNTSQMMADIQEDMDLANLVQAIPAAEDLLDSQDDAPIIRLINAILTQAIKRSASDIHIETFDQKLTVRYRIDGTLQVVLDPPPILAPLLVSRIKVMAKLDIAEKRLPQDGRITLRVAGRTIDVRVSTLPANHGERVVLRLLDKQNAKLDLTHLGMSPAILTLMKSLIFRPHGIILVTGPTGSGKTTTLYAALTDLNDATRNILTVEDPVEYELPGIGQTQVNPKIDMTFARGLRAILRQDPDVVMIGEIRDYETAEIAIQSSLTGHLVLSTLHTNTAIGAITRLRDMGIEAFLLSSTVIGLLAQRLVRTLCPHCKTARTATTEERELLGASKRKSLQLYAPVGCNECIDGYHGRKGIYELIPIDESMRVMIHDKASETELEKYAHSQFSSIRQEGFKLILAGDTTLDEVLRVTNE